MAAKKRRNMSMTTYTPYLFHHCDRDIFLAILIL
jgi:hypothetical protein